MITKKKIVIVSLSKDEAITKIMIQNKKSLKRNISVVLLSDLLSELEILDEISDTQKSINWYKNGVKIVSNSSHSILNRVNYIPKELFSNFKEEDQEYAQREFEAYLGFSFNSFRGVANNSTNGLCEKTMSLPFQWKLISNSCHIAVPSFYWGPISLSTLNTNSSTVYSSIYNLTNWSTSSQPLSQEHVFCFNRPKGDPIFIFTIGKKTLITSEVTISEKNKLELRNLVQITNEITKYFISETLFFFDGKKFTFGCVNPVIIRSYKNKLIDEFVVKNLLDEFDRCAS